MCVDIKMFLFSLATPVMMTEARLKHKNNIIKRKVAFPVNTIPIFISCNENIHLFTGASHS